MNSKIFSSMEIDAIGEILNISLGASATAVSTMLGKRVDITTPDVEVVSYDDFEYSDMEPAIAVEITYISGLSGSNIMLLKRNDVRMIVGLLMGMEISDEEFELNEMNTSAICEVMNQMMGASSTALSEFLGEVVNISTPVSYEIKDVDSFKKKCFGDEDEMVVVNFKLKIENLVESRFMNLMPIKLAKKLISAFGMGFGLENFGGEESHEEPVKKEEIKQTAKEETEEKPQSSSKVLSQEEIEKLLNSNLTQDDSQSTASEEKTVQPAAAENTANIANTAAPQAQTASYAHTEQAPMQNQQPVQGYGAPASYPGQVQSMNMNQFYAQPEPKMINTQPLNPRQFSMTESLGEEQAENLALIMDVPLEISVEIGRTKKVIKDILELTTGSLVVLDKLAGDQVDIYANGQCIAKGDVVVVDDNFGVRITEIVKRDEILKGKQ